MFFDQFLPQNQQQSLLGGAMSPGGLGSLANLIAMGAGGGVAPVIPQPGAVPSSGPTGSPMPAMPQPPQSNVMQSLMQLDPQRLRQMLMGLGLGGGMGGQIDASPGLISNLLASPDFSSFPGIGGGSY